MKHLYIYDTQNAAALAQERTIEKLVDAYLELESGCSPEQEDGISRSFARVILAVRGDPSERHPCF